MPSVGRKPRKIHCRICVPSSLQRLREPVIKKRKLLVAKWIFGEDPGHWQ